ncbi:thiamine phosphate synthase [uncultured Cohaesibacter sp.]|uniref:thiamine phosphate synthase n=1 Tax=uncultured Cohaesibacter sp. TaxID=1002546 RepID=UPI0029C994BF|nr:thiamine phosphate synthase [uncultured Cohaesibacter sp.]
MNLSVYFVTPDNPAEALVLAALRGGAGVVQLRDKHATDEEMIAKALRIKEMTDAHKVPLIINDRVAVAKAIDAAGLHIGQSDGDPVVMREAIGPDKILGLSIENEDQLVAMKALPEGTIDYIGAGPIRATATKTDAADPIGFEALGRICEASPVATVAIGGIGKADIAALKALGCAGLSVVSAISAAEDPEAATRDLVKEWSKA